ncbi:MAG: RNA polymerase sigma factor [Chitinophagaceae bacterium]
MLNQPEFIVQLKQGEEVAFTKLVNDYEGMVYNTVLGILQVPADADDITQEVFIQVYRSISSFKGESQFSTWLYRIAINKALDYEKTTKRKKRFAFIQSLFGKSDSSMTTVPDFNHPGVILEKKQSSAALFAALKKIPEKQRIAFTLHKLEGQSYRAVADIMETTVIAVESLMARAKESLRKELKYFYQHEKY